MITHLLRPLRSLSASLDTLPIWMLVPLSIGVSTLMATGSLIVLRQGGWLQQPELLVYDYMMRLRDDQPTDPRLLIVAITEADLQQQQRWPLTDQTIAQLLQQLQRAKPRVIGMDLYRDLPQEPGNKALMQQLQAANVIAITKLPDPDNLGVPPPPGVPEERIGFNDLVSDSDGVLRRGLLFASLDETTTLYSFALRLALAYLDREGIAPQAGLVDTNNLRLHQAEFEPLHPTFGQYQTIDASGYQILLNYRNRRYVAQQVSLSEVLAGSVDAALIRDKVVLIGSTATSLRDVFLTPFSAAERETPKMAGVVIHGQIVSQLLSNALDQQPLVWDWPDALENLWMGGWAILGGGLAWLVRNPLRVGLYILLGVGGLGWVGYIVFLYSGWIPIASPFLGFVSTASLLMAYRAQRSQRQQQMMMKLLGQNTSPEIATALWKSRDRLLKSGKLPGQRLTATMLFTDIRNFSTISEDMPPENLLEWLNEYLSAMTEEVRANQGIINKFTGDGILAVFGVPVNRTTLLEIDQDAQAAVRCALAMGDRLQVLNQTWQTRGMPVIQMRVGIFTGPIVAGSLGGKDRLEYGVIGDSVNTASRLESYDKDRQDELCRVLIGKDTLVHLHEQFAVEHWGLLALKGKHHTVDVYRVLGQLAEPPRTEP